MGRKIRIVQTTTDVTQAVSRGRISRPRCANQGKAQLDADGNVVTAEGKPWIGGNPFPDPKNGLRGASRT